jgi:hypothetical protein
MNFAKYPIKAGDKRVITVAVKKNGLAVDVSGYGATFSVVGKVVNFELTVGSGIEVLGGNFIVTVLPEHTSMATFDDLCAVTFAISPPLDGPFTPEPNGEKWLVKA